MTTFTRKGGRAGQFPPTGQRSIRNGDLVTDGADGGTVGSIAASVFGLSVIEECSALVKNDNTTIIPCVPAYDGKSLLGRAAGTAAPAAIPAGTYAVVVKGY